MTTAEPANPLRRDWHENSSQYSRLAVARLDRARDFAERAEAGVSSRAAIYATLAVYWQQEALRP
jgi:hypothetical protein